MLAGVFITFILGLQVLAAFIDDVKAGVYDDPAEFEEEYKRLGIWS